MDEKSIIKQANDWIRNSVMLKFATITLLMLLLLIPLFMVGDIITDREEMNKTAINDVSSKWAESQEINGPIMVIPVDYVVMDDGKPANQTRYWYTLPENLDIQGQIAPEKLYRGIYEVVVYKSELEISGTFRVSPDIDSTNLNRIRYQDAFLTMGVSDLRGIEDQVDFQWDNKPKVVKPGTKIPETVPSGMTVSITGLASKIDREIPFRVKMKLQGSRMMHFIPLGSTTTVKINSDWDSPSFTGNFLPDNRDLPAAGGFTADWKVLQLNRNFPQSWVGTLNHEKLSASSFGLDLLLPLDDYQKATRSSKYGAMTIALTFLVFFLVEVINKRKIHPFQYALVGLALCLFYILLVSLSEHVAFNVAYMIATLSVVSMITLYSLSIFNARKLTGVLAITLLGIYGFLFVTLQLADYALLLGSLGLTIILAMTMYFTRNINWYKLNIAQG